MMKDQQVYVIPDVTYRESKSQKPKIQIPWEQIKALASIHCTVTEISHCLNITIDTLKRAAKEQFGTTIGTVVRAWAKAGNCSLRRKQWKLADRSAAMAIFLGKQYLDQKDNFGMEHQGDMVQEIIHYGTSNPKKWNDIKK